MPSIDYTWVLRFLNLSIVCFALPIIIRLSIRIYSHYRKENAIYYKPATHNLIKMVSLFGFVFAAFFIHYAVGYFQLRQLGEELSRMSYVEECLDSLFRAVRTFGVPEHFTDFVADFRGMLAVVCSKESARLHDALVVYVALVDGAILFEGSALILGIFTKVFPRLKLAWENVNYFREKCYFSGLNPQTLALAKSMIATSRAEKRWLRPLIVFTDTYVDKEEESSTELLLEAKQIGAICLRDDLAHVWKAWWGKRHYFLMEENEYANLPALMGLVEESNVRCIKNARIYLFAQSNMYERLNRNIRRQLKEKCTDDELPALIPVNAYRHLVNNLMLEVPLYEPLVHKTEHRDKLGVAVLGNGCIGTEALLSAYWFGQMMTGTKETPEQKGDISAVNLTLYAVSQDSLEVFNSKLDYVNPEIRRSCATFSAKGEPQPADDCLCRGYEANEKNAPYATIHYQKADVKKGHLSEEDAWLDADYFIVALGSDADNIAVANKLNAYFGRKHLENQDKSKHTVIAYVVYNSNLCRALNADFKAENGVFMYAFGGLDEVYSCDNVFMSKSCVKAAQTGQAYARVNEQAHFEAQRKRADDDKANYTHMSDIARAMHIRYKIFSLGWVETTVFDSKRERDEELLRLSRMYTRVCGLSADALSVEDRMEQKDLKDKCEALAWLEHRRWNAFLRSMGYRRSTETNHPLKLHTCLVETCSPDEKADSFSYKTDLKAYYDANESAKKAYEEGKLDNLDLLSINAAIAYEDPDMNYKTYDYPEQDVGAHYTPAQLLAMNQGKNGKVKVPRLTEQALRKRCARNNDENVFRGITVDGEDWIFSEEWVKTWLGKAAFSELTKKEENA